MPLAGPDSLTRSQVARLTGTSGETIRYYEKVGLLPAPERADNGYRHYARSHVTRLNFIQQAKSLGFSSADIRELLTIADGPGEHTRSEVKSLTHRHIATVQERIRELQRMETVLSNIAGQCDGADEGADQCPILLLLFSQSSPDANDSPRDQP